MNLVHLQVRYLQGMKRSIYLQLVRPEKLFDRKAMLGRRLKAVIVRLREGIGYGETHIFRLRSQLR